MFHASRLSLSLAIGLSTAFITGNATADVRTMFAPDRAIKTEIKAYLSQADSGLDLAMYSFSDRSLQDAVIEVIESGVPTRIILHKANSKRELSERLEAAGADVRYVTPTMHHKFALINGPAYGGSASDSLLITGSGNWSNSATSRYDEDFMFMDGETTMNKAFQKEFDYLWDNAREFGDAWDWGLPKTRVSTDRVVFTSSNLEPFIRAGKKSWRSVVDAEDGVGGRTLIKAINSAEESILIATAHFRRPDIADALIDAMNRGVYVQMVIDGQEFHQRGTNADDFYQDERLANAGAEVRYKVNYRYWDYRTAEQMHVKYMVVDERTVLTGSLNWSFNAELRTMENLVRLNNRSLARDYRDHFLKVFTYGEGLYEDLLDDVAAQDGQGPCFFGAISLEPDQLKNLRRSYARGACR